MTVDTPIEMINIWRHGCSCAPPDHPEECQECTRVLVDAIEVWLRMPLWKRILLNSRGYEWLRKYVAWKHGVHPQIEPPEAPASVEEP